MLPNKKPTKNRWYWWLAMPPIHIWYMYIFLYTYTHRSVCLIRSIVWAARKGGVKNLRQQQQQSRNWALNSWIRDLI